MSLLTKLQLQESVAVENVFYKIKTGHTYWFRFAELAENENARYGDFVFLFAGDAPKNMSAGFKALVDFYAGKKELPRSDGNDASEKIIDYAIDADLIYSAFWKCYNIDLCERELHWHKVRALLTGLTDTRLNEVMSYRMYKGKDKEYLKMKRAWKLANGETKENKASREKFMAKLEASKNE